MVRGFPLLVLFILAAVNSGCLTSRPNVLTLLRPTKPVPPQPSDADGYRARAKYYSDNIKHHQAIADWTSALRLDPANSEAYLGRARDYYFLQVYGKALADNTAALRLDPRSAKARDRRGNYFLHYDEPAKAVDEFSEALRQDPTLWYVLANRAMAYMAMGDQTHALEDADELVRLHPMSNRAHGVRALTYLIAGKVGLGLGEFCLATALNPLGARFSIHLEAHSLFFGFGFYPKFGPLSPETSKQDYDKIIADCTTRIKANPNNLAAYYQRATMHYWKKEDALAAADYSAVIRLDPGDAYALRCRGDCFAHQQRYVDAFADLDEAIRLEPDNPYGFCYRAWTSAAQGTFEQALADYDQAIRLDPKLTISYSSRAWVYENMHRYDDAIADCTQLLRLSPHSIKTYRRRAKLYLIKKDFAKAKADYRKANSTTGVESEDEDYAQCAMAWDLATTPWNPVRDGPAAVKYATMACKRAHWKDADTLDLLAAAHAECGQFDEAVRRETEALARAYWLDDKADYRARLQLYQARKPYRQEDKSNQEKK